MQATIASTDAERVPFWSALIRDRRIAPALGLGFTSGMPFLLTYSMQSAWLTDAGVPLATIGLLNELTLAYKFKFVWAPFLDQYDPPLIGGVLGRRRGWLLVAILAVIAMLAGIAFGDPGHWIWWTVGFSFALGIAGATLDLVLDGWRITSVRPPEKQAVLSSWTEIGWRVGNLAAKRGSVVSAVASLAARARLRPSARRVWMFSMMTVASSTRMPTANANPPKVMMLIV
jgi:PAT family beta-lactamase induction signal transducer AmpG